MELLFLANDFSVNPYFEPSSLVKVADLTGVLTYIVTRPAIQLSVSMETAIYLDFTYIVNTMVWYGTCNLVF